MSDFLERSKQLLGEQKIKSFEDKIILVIGIGGVGGTAAEALARSGFKNFILIDSDVVDPSNINRQILFTKNDIGKNKVDVAKERLNLISDNIQVTTYKCKIGETHLEDILDTKIDFIIDAIDYVEGKLEIYNYAIEKGIGFISSLGMGNRVDPEKVILTSLNKTENDPLAKKMRYEAKRRDIDLKKVPVVFSTEVPLLKSPKPASMMMVPSTAGLLIAKYIISTI